MQNKQINSWADFNEITEYFGETHTRIDWLYRGQQDRNWSLKPSLLRYLPVNISRKHASGYEQGTLLKFFSEYALYKEDEVDVDLSNDIVQLMIMQHYNCPTRLLDWSESIYIALYFAVENGNNDGAIFCIPGNIVNTKTDYKVNGHAMKTLKQLDEFSGETILYPFAATSKTKRMAIQQGWVTVSNNILADHLDILENYSSNDLIKLDVRSTWKNEALDRLHHMNISGKTLFPGLDGLGRWNRELIKIRTYRERK